MLTVASFREIKSKKMAFVAFNLGTDEGMYTLGWRIIKGVIHPPASRGKGATYWPVAYLTRRTAEELYTLILEQHQESLLKAFPDSYSQLLADKDAAIEGIVMPASGLHRYFGSELG